MMEGMGTFGVWGPGFGWLFMILFWVFVVLGVVALVRWLYGSSGSSQNSPPQKTALQILEERYARGEIERDEFEQKRKDLIK